MDADGGDERAGGAEALGSALGERGRDPVQGEGSQGQAAAGVEPRGQRRADADWLSRAVWRDGRTGAGGAGGSRSDGSGVAGWSRRGGTTRRPARHTAARVRGV